MKRILTFLLFFVVLVPTIVSANIIEEGKTVKIDYTLKIDDKVVETTDGKDPLEYVSGEKNIVPGLEMALIGLKEGDQKEVVVKPEDGYGKVDEKSFQEVQKSTFPENIDLKQGAVLSVKAQDTGKSIPCMIWEIKEETVILNFNHPLAGKELHFDVKIVKVD